MRSAKRLRDDDEPTSSSKVPRVSPTSSTNGVGQVENQEKEGCFDLDVQIERKKKELVRLEALRELKTLEERAKRLRDMLALPSEGPLMSTFSSSVLASTSSDGSPDGGRKVERKRQEEKEEGRRCRELDLQVEKEPLQLKTLEVHALYELPELMELQEKGTYCKIALKSGKFRKSKHMEVAKKNNFNELLNRCGGGSEKAKSMISDKKTQKPSKHPRKDRLCPVCYRRFTMRLARMTLHVASHYAEKMREVFGGLKGSCPVDGCTEKRSREAVVASHVLRLHPKEMEKIAGKDVVRTVFSWY